MPKKLSNALTVAEVKSKPAGRYADGGGLYLLVKDTGARSWVFRFMLKGKARDVGLGSAAGKDGITLAKARDLALDLKRKVQAEIDPLTERQEKAATALASAQAAKVASITFRTVAEAYIAVNSPSWKNDKHRQQWANTLQTYVYPVIGDLPVAEVDTPHVLQIIEPIWGDKPETASRVRGRIETVLDSAKVRGYRQGENPARWRGHIAQILPPRTRLSRGHHAALPYDLLPNLIHDLRGKRATAALALEFAILTACRSNEVYGATWGEIDLQKAEWTIPADRMKAGFEHKVPLSKRALEILGTVLPLQSTGEALGEQYTQARANSPRAHGILNAKPLFPSDNGRKLSGMAMAMLLRRMKNEVTVHGFRSTFRDWAAERTSYAHEVCEMALAHTIGNKSEAAYRRGNLFEKRRRLMDDWATYCGTPEATGSNVTPIKAAL
jgi:integrase